jgi:hypothetical protein
VNGAGAYDYFAASVLPDFKGRYPLPGWVIEQKYDTAQDGNKSKLSYTLTATQTAGPLTAGGGVQAVEGEVTKTVDRDEQQRLTTVWSYDLLTEGDPAALLHRHPPGRPVDRAEGVGRDHAGQGAPPPRQLHGPDQRVRIQADELAGKPGDPAGLPDLRGQVYVGANPVVVQQPRGIEVLRQRGSAIGEGAWLQAPAPLFDSSSSRSRSPTRTPATACSASRAGIT